MEMNEQNIFSIYRNMQGKPVPAPMAPYETRQNLRMAASLPAGQVL